MPVRLGAGAGATSTGRPGAGPRQGWCRTSPSALLANDPATLQLQLDALARFCTDCDMDGQPGQNQGVGVQLRAGLAAGQPASPSTPGSSRGSQWNRPSSTSTWGSSLTPSRVQCRASPTGRLWAPRAGSHPGHVRQQPNSDITDPSVRLHLWQQAGAAGGQLHQHADRRVQHRWHLALPLGAHCPPDVLLQHLDEQAKQGGAQAVAHQHPYE